MQHVNLSFRVSRRLTAKGSAGVVAIVLVLLLAGCPSPLDEPTTDAPDVLPVVAFDSGSLISAPAASSRSVVPASMSTEEVYHTMSAPLLSGFQPNTADAKSGDSLTYTFLDTAMTVTISRSGGTFVFSGELDDGDGWMRLEYTPADHTFDYEHAYYFKDEHDVLGNGSYLEAVAYVRMQDITVGPGQTFHGSFDLTNDFLMTSATGETVAEGYQTMIDAEIYRGPMELASGASFDGTGVASYVAYSSHRSDAPASTVSGPPSLANVDDMVSFMDVIAADSAGSTEYPFLSIHSEDTGTFYELGGSHADFGLSADDLSSIQDETPSAGDYAIFVEALPTGGWQEATALPASR